jgi:hypothetical protein
MTRKGGNSYLHFTLAATNFTSIGCASHAKYFETGSLPPFFPAQNALSTTSISVFSKAQPTY